MRPVAGRTAAGPSSAHGGEFLFLFVLKGALGVDSAEIGRHRLQAGDCCVIPAGVPHSLAGGPGLEMLEVTLPADLTPAVGDR